MVSSIFSVFSSENHHVIGGCSTSGDELHKTESSVPFSPSTATSKLSIGSSPKRPSKTKKWYWSLSYYGTYKIIIIMSVKDYFTDCNALEV